MTSVIYQFKIKPVINFMTTTLCYNFGLKIVNQDLTAGDPREIKFVHKFFYFRDVISCIKCSSLRTNHWLLRQITTHTLLPRWYRIRIGPSDRWYIMIGLGQDIIFNLRSKMLSRRFNCTSKTILLTSPKWWNIPPFLLRHHYFTASFIQM